MTQVDSRHEITARLRRQAELADLRPEARLAHKVDMTPSGVSRRLRLQAELRRACRRWARL